MLQCYWSFIFVKKTVLPSSKMKVLLALNENVHCHSSRLHHLPGQAGLVLLCIDGLFKVVLMSLSLLESV